MRSISFVALAFLLAHSPAQAWVTPKNPVKNRISSLKNSVGIFGADDRATAYNHPVYNAIQRLVVLDGKGTCSAALLGRYYVLTASHCVKDGPPVGLQIDFGNGFSEPIPVAQYWMARNFTWTADEFNEPYLLEDFAILRLTHPVPASLGHLDIATPEEARAGVAAISVGYPVYTYGGLLRVKDNHCSVRSLPSGAIRTDCAMSRGNSGGPLLVKGKDGTWKVAGISSTQYIYPDGGMVLGEPYRDARANFYTNVTLYKSRIMKVIDSDRAALGIER